MIKRFKKWGDSIVLVFTQEEVRMYGIKEGDTITIDDMLWEEKIHDRKKKEVTEQCHQ